MNGGIITYVANILIFLHQSKSHVLSTPSFTIDYEKNTFLKDGKPFRYISGGMHYFRIPYQLWEDRLYKAKMAGLNTIQTYIPWNFHETFQGKYKFEGQKDLVQFINIAQQQGLLVILRPGPYICSEWDYGGFPFWIYEQCGDKIRTADDEYLGLVDKWFSVLFPKLTPLLYARGGPIIAFQVENEYGSYGCDSTYMSKMTDLLTKYVGSGSSSAILFTTDGTLDRMVKCGSTPNTYTTVDFGPEGEDPSKYFAVQRKYQKQGPFVNSEFYTGQLDHWGEKHHTINAELVASSLDKILALNASVNFYMFIGGTNLNQMSGANMVQNKLKSITTSYDFDAPLNEAGDPTEKYWQIQKVISKYNDIPSGPQPVATPKKAYGKYAVSKGTSLFNIEKMRTPIENVTPLTFESLGIPYGYVIYRTSMGDVSKEGADLILDLGKFGDRANIFVDRKFQGVLNRNYESRLVIQHGEVLDILMESQGRIGYSRAMLDASKGLKSNVTLNGETLENWQMWCLGATTESDDSPFVSIPPHILRDEEAGVFQEAPGVYNVTFMVDGKAEDTYLKLDQWTKGVIYINGMSQKYWTKPGPQNTLYIPSTSLLSNAINKLVIFETDYAPGVVENRYVEFVDKPIFV